MGELQRLSAQTEMLPIMRTHGGLISSRELRQLQTTIRQEVAEGIAKKVRVKIATEVTMADELNNVIQQEVQKARNEGIDITYVPPAFGGHGLCDRGYPWINEAVVDADNNPQAESFHPNAEGYWLGYGISFKLQIQS